MPSSAELHRSLRDHFGHPSFREGQLEVIEACLGGRDVLAVMPTGGGKSLCYQLPALLLEGITLVVSPLIALMKDQVDALRARDLPATSIHSGLTAGERARRLAGCRAGEYRLVYIAPERLRSRVFRSSLSGTRVVRLAIDEAHCISQWGHDFRPDYLRLGELRETLGSPPTLALTATATPQVQGDIARQLGLREPAVFLAGFERPNLRLSVRKVRSVREKTEAVEAALQEVGGPGIVYAATRKHVESVAGALREKGRRALAYHAGLTDRQRSEAQEAFMGGEVEVIAATNAFGMGVDKADIRFVLHYDIPGSLEAYYQEAGRAGRDGKLAECCLLYSFADVRVQEFFLDGANPEPALIESVLGRIRDDRDLEGTARNPMAVETAVHVLERQGLVERDAEGVVVVTPRGASGRVSLDRGSLEEKARRDRERLASMIRYAESRTCRRAVILGYFSGRAPEGGCGHCDRCLGWHERPGRPLSEPERRVVRIALSGVARVPDRFGRARIARMLVGSRAREVSQFGLERIPTHGKLAGLPATGVGELLERLADAGLLRRRELRGSGTMGGSVLSLTPEGVRVMQDPEADLRLAWPEGLPAPGTAPADPDLREALRRLRLRLSRDRGVPAFQVFPDRVLDALVAARPGTLEELEAVPGIGPATRDRYGRQLIDLIRGHSGREAAAGKGRLQ
ncbi:MAG: ATP-dependent DNA helicase RecQ [Acidobacteriota bacterium]|jgi:ATP-dependent DNA helicase RecQ